VAKTASTASTTIFNVAPGSYLDSTRQPMYALAFLLPLVVIYEVGTFYFNTDHLTHTEIRVAAFSWLRRVAELAGVHPKAAWAFPGFAVLIILLCWQLSSRRSWRVKPMWVGWMALESLLLTAPLFAIGALLNSSLAAEAGGQAVHQSYGPRLVTSIGAGIYEELVFRLILIGLLLLLLEDLLHVPTTIATLLAVFLSAAVFSAHHYVTFEGWRLVRLAHESFTAGSFLFRTAAGIYFAFLFRYRGYGVTAGTHAVFNMIYFAFK